MEQIIDILIQSSWQILLLSLLVWPLSRLSRRAYPNFAYTLWVVILIKALVPINFSLSSQPIPVADLAPVMSGEFILPDAATSSNGIPFIPLALGLWVMGVTFLAGRLLMSEYAHRNRMKDAYPIAAENWLDSLRESMGIGQAVALYGSSAVHSPLMQGLWRPRIYLPHGFESWQLDDQRSVLAHELTHIKRKDIVIIYLQAVVRTLYFFHPVVWLVNDQIDLEREKICDDEAINYSRTERERYGEQLFRQLAGENEESSVPILAGGFFMSDTSLIKRFRYIKEKRGNMKNALKPYHALLILIIVSLAVLLACTSEGPAGGAGSEGIAKPTEASAENVEFEAYDTPPEPVGGYRAIQEAVIYPDLARLAGIEGTVIVQTTITKEGAASASEILRGVDDMIDVAAVEAVESIVWIPAQKQDEPVSVRISIPIVFRLQSGDGAKLTTHWMPSEQINPIMVIMAGSFDEELVKQVAVRFYIDENGKVKETKLSAPKSSDAFTLDIKRLQSDIKRWGKVEWVPTDANTERKAAWVTLPMEYTLTSD